MRSIVARAVGQDAAPAHARSKFIGLFKVCTDAGTFMGPLTVGILMHVVGLDAATWSVSMLAGAFALYYLLVGRAEGTRAPSRSSTRPTRRHQKLVEEPDQPAAALTSHPPSSRAELTEQGQELRLVEDDDRSVPPTAGSSPSPARAEDRRARARADPPLSQAPSVPSPTGVEPRLCSKV